MREWYRKSLIGVRILQLFIITMVIFLIMVNITIPKVRSFAGGMELLDLLPAGYSYEYVNSLFSALGEEGRHQYLFYQIPIDMLYPALFAVTYSLIIAFLLHKLRVFNWGLFYLVLLPIGGGFFDYCENFGIIGMLNSFPQIPKIAAQLTNISSILKSTFSTLSFIVIIILLLAFGFRKLFLDKRIQGKE